MRFALLLGLALVLASCDPSTPPPPDAGIDAPIILDVVVAQPAIEGSAIEVRGLGLDRIGLDARLSMERAGESVAVLDVVPGSDDVLVFLLSAEAVGTLGPGMHTLDLVAFGNGLASQPYEITLRLVGELPVDLFETPRGEVHRNDVAVVNGNGIISATEGELTAQLVGTFTADAGGSSAVDVTLPVAPLERVDRERGVIVLTTDIGGLQPGTFDGTIQLRSRLRSGQTSESGALTTTLHFNPPDLYTLDPTEATVGQVLHVLGAGFLGGPDRPDETTLIRLEGVFTPSGGEPPEPFGPQEIVPGYVSGSEVQLVVEPAIRRDVLASALFGHARGTFMGTATPIAIRGTEELEGAAVPFGFVLGPVRQVVYVRFLPGLYSSLTSFGLDEAAPEVEARVQERMRDIYASWNVDLRFEEPDDYVRSAYSVVEIGGPDPNGVGLFGYDNSPGKDIGNLRLFDSIGGTNAETQMDGYPGYGGVFVESFLFWSSHPDLPGDPPPGAPDPEPLFDEIFDPVRNQPATRAEARGEGTPERNAAVAAAIRALGSIIGETTSHELGHSLGMAQPYGSPTVYHNDFDGEGCLMDSGGDRPLGERMALPGYSTSTFCHDHPDYMDEILPR
ncbi:MAG: hypothetical protein H6719_12460 [Sandaracinaceae bacterium]|nr:hypothetical protein [Sandaracinaceae bacterium]